ncbi:MAG: hypothetical protein KDD78_15890 [Caldilineaceae bacterium]|nr:hypothetical protein [Caldilineaceae bacterium]
MLLHTQLALELHQERLRDAEMRRVRNQNLRLSRHQRRTALVALLHSLSTKILQRPARVRRRPAYEG